MSFPLKYILCGVYCLIITFTVVSSDDIPVMLWNIKGNAMHMKPVSALGSNDKVFSGSLNDIHNEGSSVIVFAVKKLSLEDFSTKDELSVNKTLYSIESFLDNKPHLFIPSVKDPLNHVHKTHCAVKEIVVDNKIDESIMQLVSSALQQSCVVILHIADEGIGKEGELKSVFLPTFENSNKNIVGIFTGVKSSWGTPNSDHHMFRNLLAAAPSDDNYLNFTDCLIMYGENATISVGENNVSLPFPPNLDGSSCGNFSLLQLNFETSGALSTVTIKLNFTQRRGAWTTSGTVSMTGEKALEDEIDLNTESIGAPLGFSYSCGDFLIKSKNSTFDVTIKMEGFQVQPFQVKDKFSDSFDCVPYFTIPIWMGIFTSLLLIAILNIGIYALFSVHTMDRFDDPKGKTISVGATAD